jgi:hypothetical protein
MLADDAIALIEQHGLHGLCRFDGCPCIDFDVHHVHVSISCHKSQHQIVVESSSLDYDEQSLMKVMFAVKEAFEKAFGYAPESYAYIVRRI